MRFSTALRSAPGRPGMNQPQLQRASWSESHRRLESRRALGSPSANPAISTRAIRAQVSRHLCARHLLVDRQALLVIVGCDRAIEARAARIAVMMPPTTAVAGNAIRNQGQPCRYHGVTTSDPQLRLLRKSVIHRCSPRNTVFSSTSTPGSSIDFTLIVMLVRPRRDVLCPGPQAYEDGSRRGARKIEGGLGIDRQTRQAGRAKRRRPLSRSLVFITCSRNVFSMRPSSTSRARAPRSRMTSTLSGTRTATATTSAAETSASMPA